MTVLKEPLIIIDDIPDKHSEHLGGYSVCFHVNKFDDLEEIADTIANQVYDNIIELVQTEGIYAIGWMIRKYTGSSNIH